MKIQVVRADPRDTSLTASLVERFVAGVQSAGPARVEIATLQQEGFDPRISQADLDFYHGNGSLPDDVRSQQQRVDDADVLLIAFPVYWWSLPAVLKGWIDRVFTNGWAFGGAERSSGALSGKRIRIIATGGAGSGAYEKHGYRAAITAQIEHGIFHFSGVSDVQTHFFLDVENGDKAARLRNLTAAYELGRSLNVGEGDPAAVAAA